MRSSTIWRSVEAGMEGLGRNGVRSVRQDGDEIPTWLPGAGRSLPEHGSVVAHPTLGYRFVGVQRSVLSKEMNVPAVQAPMAGGTAATLANLRWTAGPPGPASAAGSAASTLWPAGIEAEGLPPNHKEVSRLPIPRCTCCTNAYAGTSRVLAPQEFERLGQRHAEDARGRPNAGSPRWTPSGRVLLLQLLRDRPP